MVLAGTCIDENIIIKYLDHHNNLYYNIAIHFFYKKSQSGLERESDELIIEKNNYHKNYYE